MCSLRTPRFVTRPFFVQPCSVSGLFAKKKLLWSTQMSQTNLQFCTLPSCLLPFLVWTLECPLLPTLPKGGGLYFKVYIIPKEGLAVTLSKILRHVFAWCVSIANIVSITQSMIPISPQKGETVLYQFSRRWGIHVQQNWSLPRIIRTCRINLQCRSMPITRDQFSGIDPKYGSIKLAC